MSWKRPIDYTNKKELLKEKRFYRKLGEMCNFMDEKTVMLVYIGLTQVVAQELRRNKFIRLPHLGDFALVPQKPRPGWMGKMRVMMGKRNVLKFYPKEKLRRYFNQFERIK